MTNKKMRLLITGGAGFIASHLCDNFIGKGHTVFALDNLITGSLENTKHLKNNPRFNFIKHDISKPLKIQGGLDYVLHFASPASPPDYLKHPIATLKVGSLGSLNALGVAKAKKAKFFLASTSEVYGDPLITPQKESYWGNVNSVGPRSVYDESKRFAEAITMAYYREHGVDAKIIRIFNTYGERMRPEDGRVIPNFISQALLGKPLTVYGKGDQTRSYCYVSDLVRGIECVMNSKLNQPVNLGNPNEMSVLLLAKRIQKLVGSNNKIIYEPLPVDDPKQRCPDISLAKKELRWAPQVDLDEGLLRTIEYFKTKVLS